MKKFLFWATVVGVSFTSCVSDNEAVLTSEDNPQAITFEVAKYKPSSRAEGDDTQTASTGSTSASAFSTNQTFGTFAYKSATVSGDHSVFMDNEQVGYVNSYWIAMGDTYYWPETGHLDFISYYPYAAYDENDNLPASVPVVGDNESEGDNNKLTYTGYTVAEGVDLMYSDKAHLQTKNILTYYFAGVPTLFRHALAKLNFKVRTQSTMTEEGTAKIYWRTLIHSIEIGEINNTGSVTLVTTSSNEAKTTPWVNTNTNYDVWKESGKPISKKWEVSGGQLLNADTEKKGEVFSNASDYYVLPQVLNNQYITIKYSVANRGESSAEYDTPTEFTRTLLFKDYTIPAWQMGENITYLIQIDPKGNIIHFDPAVTAWEEVYGGTIDI